MLIESIIQRAKGSSQTMDGITYRFQPLKPNGPHVCEVANPHHAQKFLAVPEAFRFFTGEAENNAPVGTDPVPVQAVNEQALSSSVVIAADQIINDGAVVSNAHIDNMTQHEATSAVTHGTSDDPTDTASTASAADGQTVAPQQIPTPTPPAADPPPAHPAPPEAKSIKERVAAMDVDTLRAVYEKHNGRAAPSNTREETLRDRVTELLETAA